LEAKGVESAQHLVTIATLCGVLGKDLVCKNSISRINGCGTQRCRDK